MKIDWNTVVSVLIAGALLIALDRLVLGKMLDKTAKLIGEEDSE